MCLFCPTYKGLCMLDAAQLMWSLSSFGHSSFSFHRRTASTVNTGHSWSEAIIREFTQALRGFTSPQRDDPLTLMILLQWTDLTPQNAAINAGVTRHNPWKIMVSMCVGCTDRWNTRKKSVARNKQIKYGNNKHTVTPTTGLVPLRLTQALWSSHQKHGITNQTEDQSLTLSWF